MNGARGRSNNFLLDGTDMNDGYRNDPAINEAGVFGTPATILPIDAVSELRVLSNYQPEYGRNAGGVINIVTKSGTNTWHGDVFDYFRNNALDARNFFNTDGPAPGRIPEQPVRRFAGRAYSKGQDVFLRGLRRPARGCRRGERIHHSNDHGFHPTVINGAMPVPINQVVGNLLQRNPWSLPGNAAPCAIYNIANIGTPNGPCTTWPPVARALPLPSLHPPITT